MRKTKLKSYMVYLDPHYDADIIRFLGKLRRGKVAAEIREALIVYLAYKSGAFTAGEAPAKPMRPEPSYHDIDEVPETAVEASRTFLKPRR